MVRFIYYSNLNLHGDLDSNFSSKNFLISLLKLWTESNHWRKIFFSLRFNFLLPLLALFANPEAEPSQTHSLCTEHWAPQHSFQWVFLDVKQCKIIQDPNCWRSNTNNEAFSSRNQLILLTTETYYSHIHARDGFSYFSMIFLVNGILNGICMDYRLLTMINNIFHNSLHFYTHN